MDVYNQWLLRFKDDAVKYVYDVGFAGHALLAIIGEHYSNRQLQIFQYFHQSQIFDTAGFTGKPHEVFL